MTEGESGPGLTSDIYRRSVYEIDPGETVYILYHPQSSKNASERHILAKSSDFGLTWTELLKDVIRVWAPRGVKVDIPRPHDKSSISFDLETKQDYETVKLGHFLYASHFSDTKNQTVQLSVSTDGGRTFNKAHLPTIQAERFYSVLEVEDDSAFVHVDAPNACPVHIEVLMMLFRRTMKAPRPNHPAQRTKLHQNHPPELQIFSTTTLNNYHIELKIELINIEQESQ
ncbi:unnamed protein product [Schistosoma mattheei]|uniref:Uncharacterized protein n=1 Tax=Schistosoma mattheei TaxID=31246 RepID=A0A183NSZ2_9TREM|nr:unnamed protein product [Schistosoma mattheei]